MSNADSPTPGDLDSADLDERVRTRLLHAAVRVFDRKGYAGASVREVAELAGVTKPTLYYHFGSKEGMLRAVLDQAKQQVSGIAQRALARQGTARHRVDRVLRRGLRDVRAERPGRACRPRRVPRPARRDAVATTSRLRGGVPHRPGPRSSRRDRPRANCGRWPPTDVAFAVMGILEECNERQLHPALDADGGRRARPSARVVVRRRRRTARAGGRAVVMSRIGRFLSFLVLVVTLAVATACSTPGEGKRRGSQRPEQQSGKPPVAVSTTQVDTGAFSGRASTWSARSSRSSRRR